MKAIQLYQTEMDELALVKDALIQGCWLVADLHTKSPEAQRLRTVDEFQAARLKTRHFYFFVSPFDRSVLSVRKVAKDDGDFYYLSPGVGTPSLEFLGGGVFFDPDKEMRLVRPGFLEYPSQYWTTDLSTKRESPPELAALFDHLCRTLKRRSTRIKPGKTVFWIGEHAESELERGARLVGYETWLFPSRESRKPRVKAW